MSVRIAAICLVLTGTAWAAQNPPDLLELTKRSFLYGREYFVLRSGRAEMVVQADRADVGPAFGYLLFDAEDASQSSRKECAFNFDPAQGFASSELQVELGGFPFTAVAHQTVTGWTNSDGIPAAQAIWWAGPVRITERICALADGVFSRSIRLEGGGMLGPQAITLRLALPAGPSLERGRLILQVRDRVSLALAIPGDLPVSVDTAKSQIAVGPLTIGPTSTTTVETLLIVRTPALKADELAARAAALIASSAGPEHKTARDHWAGQSSLVTADRTVQEIYDKARFGLPAMIADDGTMDAGIFEYGSQWVRDTSNSVLGAIHIGEFELARNTLRRVMTKMVSPDGITMIGGGFDKPDLEQFDQMGELLHVLRTYCDWTGDSALIRDHRELLLTMIERPLMPQFRDETGMVHNRREFWERSFKDAYELAYQTYVIKGLEDAASLAAVLEANDRVERWRAEASRMRKAMLSHPSASLVHEGRLIKRRNLTGDIADLQPDFPGFAPDTPAKTESHRRLCPDASMALPIALGVVDPHSELARRTLDDLEQLWNLRWSGGGYDRYHTSSQPDQPGPWSFATCFILRAQHDAGLFDRSRRSLEWLNTVQGGRTGAWFEEIPLARSTTPTSGIVPWTSAEVALFVVRHWLGVRFEGEAVVLQPALYPGSPPVTADLRFRHARLHVEVDGPGPVISAEVNGKSVAPNAAGQIVVPPGFAGGTVVIHTPRTK